MVSAEVAMNIAVLFLVAAVGMLLGILAGRVAPRWWLAVTLVGAMAALVAAVSVLVGGADWE